MPVAHLRIPTSAAFYDAAIEGLTRLNEAIMEAAGVQGDAVPPLYASGVRYRTEPRETWKHAVDVEAEGHGDCEDLSAWRAAELRVSGEDLGARVVTYQTGPRRYHAVVQRGDGTIEDPSRVLGMKVSDEMSYRSKIANAFGPHAGAVYYEDEEDDAGIMLGEDPSPGNTLTFDLYNTGKGWSGVIKLPLSFPISAAAKATGTPEAVFLKTSTSPTEADAAKKSLNILDLAKSTGLLDKLQSKIPPGAAQAAAVLTDPTVVSALKNPASLLNVTTALARPDIALDNLKSLGSKITSLF